MGAGFEFLENVCRFVCFVSCVTSVCKVTEVPGLDIWLPMLFTESYVEQFKGLSCCVPLGHPVHLSALPRVSLCVCVCVFLLLQYYVRLFFRLMKRSIKHHCVTYSLTLFSHRLLSGGVELVVRLSNELPS